MWHGTWRSTYLGISKESSFRVSCKNIFSDILHRPFFCAHTSVLRYSKHIPSSNQIPRISHLSSIEFSSDWTDKPFILTDTVKEWPVYHEWSMENLLKEYGKVSFRAEAVDWPLEVYMDYMNNNQDESPLYLFDRSFVRTMNLTATKDKTGEFWIPECFGEDFFTPLEDRRPDHQWLIIGPERSGSTFHKDPNATRSISYMPAFSTNFLTAALVHGTLFFVVQNIGSCSPALRLLHLRRGFSFLTIKVKSQAL
jgi:hypothetical protein